MVLAGSGWRDLDLARSGWLWLALALAGSGWRKLARAGSLWFVLARSGSFRVVSLSLVLFVCLLDVSKPRVGRADFRGQRPT